MYDSIIVGAGFAGSVIAEQSAKDGKKVLLIEKRNHIAGSSFDYVDEYGILVHKYGPHIFHTNIQEVSNYIEQFGETYSYEHKSLGYVDGKFIVIPFNKTSIEECFDREKADILIGELIKNFGNEKKVSIIELLNCGNKELRSLAEFVYEKIFKYYTLKQWDLLPTELDPAVTKRVPIKISYDDRYFQDKYQFMPTQGFTKIFEKMLCHQNIEIMLGVDALNVIKLENGKIYHKKKQFDGDLIFTGQIEELFNLMYGELQYRSVEFGIETYEMESYQPASMVNYPTPKEKHAFTRISEFRKFTMKSCSSKFTTIMKEYPYPYKKLRDKGNTPYYPLFNTENQNKYNKYLNESKKYPNLHLVGRLAEYKYYNIDTVIERALEYYQKNLSQQT